jgi:hypothetical protein
MSLINDALKRAKEAQQQAAPPPAPSLEFRPIEPAQVPRPSRGLMLPAILAAAALLILLLAWQWSQRSSPNALIEVKGRTTRSAPATPAPQTVAATVAPATVVPVPIVPPVPDLPLVPAATPIPEPVGAVGPRTVSDTNALVATPSDSAANTVAVAEPAPPKPAPIKLQAIVFSRTRPSVMINGKTLFVGDKLNGARVTAIDRESVTLVSASLTNVLTLQSE